MLTCFSQNIDKAFKEMGYKTQVKPLADFHDDYGFKGDDDEDDEDDEDDDEEDGSEGDYSDSESE